MNSSLGEPSSHITTITTAATERLHCRGAGNKLPALLKTLQEDNLGEDVEVSVETSGGDSGDSEVPIKCSSKEGKPKPGDVSENVKFILCCVCSKRVLDSGTVVRLALMISNVKPLHMPPVLDIQHVVPPELSSYVQITGLVKCYKALNLSLNLSLRGTALLLVPEGNNNPL